MSEGKDARDTPAPADRAEGEGGAAMSPAVTEDSGEGGAAIVPALSEDNNEGGAAMDPTVSEYSSEFKAPLPSTYSEDIIGFRAPLPSTWEDSSSDSSEAAVPPTEDKGKGKATTPPAVDEDQTMEPLAPVMSYELGSDHLDLPSDDEPKYEGKGKGRCTHSRNATSAIRQADIHAQLRVSLTSQARANRHLAQLQALGQPAMFRTTWHPVRLQPRGQPARLRTAQDPARQCQPSKFRTA